MPANSSADHNIRLPLTVLAPVSSGSRRSDAGVARQELLHAGRLSRRPLEAFERATAVIPNSSTYFHWLGKAQGRRAETSSPFTAPAYASKARQAFEKAVELDGKNLEAINDLFSYYLEAPGFLGGGLDKAANLAKRIQALDPVEYHYALAQIADKRKDYRGRRITFPPGLRIGARGRSAGSSIWRNISRRTGRNRRARRCSCRRRRSRRTNRACCSNVPAPNSGEEGILETPSRCSSAI